MGANLKKSGWINGICIETAWEIEDSAYACGEYLQRGGRIKMVPLPLFVGRDVASLVKAYFVATVTVNYFWVL